MVSNKRAFMLFKATPRWLSPERVGLMTHGGCEFETLLRRTFFQELCDKEKNTI